MMFIVFGMFLGSALILILLLPWWGVVIGVILLALLCWGWDWAIRHENAKYQDWRERW